MTARAVALLGAVVALGVGVAFLLGPRPEVDSNVAPPELPDGLAGLDAFLARSESGLDDLRPGTEKTIVWADPAAPRRTRLSIVYLHGFSATRREVSPLTERVAAELGANFFLTRLTGHGRGGEALAEASVNDWLTDAVEAFEIGRRLGEKVVVIGTSTGGTLATWLAHREAEGSDSDLAAIVLLSPNFGLRDGRSRVLTWPWGKQIARLVQGRYRSFEPENEDHARFWTTRYPTEALLPMMALVDLVADLNLGAIETPVMIVYSKEDEVIDPEAVAARFSEFGSKVKQATIAGYVDDPSNHVLAGEILSPGGTEPLIFEIVDFIQLATMEAEILADGDRPGSGYFGASSSCSAARASATHGCTASSPSSQASMNFSYISMARSESPKRR